MSLAQEQAEIAEGMRRLERRARDAHRVLGVGPSWTSGGAVLERRAAGFVARALAAGRAPRARWYLVAALAYGRLVEAIGAADERVLDMLREWIAARDRVVSALLTYQKRAADAYAAAVDLGEHVPRGAGWTAEDWKIADRAWETAHPQGAF